MEVKRHIDEIYTAHPEFGYRRICAWLNRYESIHINHKAVVFCQVKIPKMSVIIPFFRTGKFPVLSERF
ncbi:IS3 family transposase [Pectinatus frisingensis]|uniref:IS3 family transposase n=1 Tax=Pectinatus frisingensis TaxID=865 RepID=UPI003D8022EC